MDERRSDVVSAVLVIAAMFLLAGPRLLFPMNGPIPAVLGVDAIVLMATIVILLGIGNIARHLRTHG